MQNVDIKLTGTVATITIDLAKDYGPSKSGKTIIIATTSGNHKIPGTDAVIGLNCYKPR